VFEEFIREHFEKTKDFEEHQLDSASPSIFVRIVPTRTDPVPIVPLPMVAVEIDKKPTFLGLHFRIEAPLPVQSYESADTCVSHWVALLPPEGITDSTLLDARNRMTDIIKNWDNKADIHTDIVEFGKYIGDKKSDHLATVLTMVGHHDRNTFWFLENDPLVSTAVHRSFSKPSIAILNGCGTGGPGALDFIDQFSRRGVQTVIATNTQVSGEMVGDFVNCLDTVLAKHPKPGLTISQAYFRAVKCLKDRNSGKVNARSYGPRVLLYTLLGNGNLKLCQPVRGSQ
jgi:hypothetical protein